MDYIRDQLFGGWFMDEKKAEAWAFEQYRITGEDVFNDPPQERWINRNLPLPGRPKFRRGNFQPLFPFRPAERSLNNNNRAVPARAAFGTARRKLDWARNHFGHQPHWIYQKALGYGGVGIAIKYLYAPPEEPNMSFVVKFSIHDMEDLDIRQEIAHTKKMARAAHCIQLIDRDTLGMPAQVPWRFENVPWDDSSDPGESSGEESRADEPSAAYRDQRTRSERLADVAEREAKMANYTQRYQEREAERTERARLKQAEARRLETGEPPDPPPNTHDIYRMDVMFLEYCEGGDLAHLLMRLNDPDQVDFPCIPNRVLWNFWLCLVRSCVAMEYPPRKFHQRRHEPPPAPKFGHPGAGPLTGGKRVGDDLFEDIPRAKRRWAKKRMVHFDIDPSNIFIAGLDANTRDDEHKLVPRLKVADFGLADEIKLHKINAYYYWRRSLGKFTIFAPEQFGHEWDYLKTANGEAIHGMGPEISEQKPWIAGNYGAHTNVWMIGLVMWQLITRMYTPAPPQLQQGSRELGTSRHYCPLLLTDEQNYGWVDKQLRVTVARCLSHNPANRPTPAKLLADAKAAIKKRFRESDEEVEDFVQHLVFDA